MKKELKNICSYEFSKKLSPRVPSHAYLEAIEATDEYIQLKNALDKRKVTENEIRSFVKNGVDKIKPGVWSHMNVPFSVLACVLKTIDKDYADEYLKDLAESDSAELSGASRMASHCLDLKRNN